MVVSLKYAILNGDYDFFLSKRFTVIENFTSRKMCNFWWWLRIFFNLKSKRFTVIGVRGNQKNAQFLMAIAIFKI